MINEVESQKSDVPAQPAEGLNAFYFAAVARTLTRYEIMPEAAESPLSPRSKKVGGVVWLTGLSAAGKTTIAGALEETLAAQGRAVLRLDGDELRKGLCADLGFSVADRSENIRRAAAVAKLAAEAGLICIAAFISPSRADRERARQQVAPVRFWEVFVSAPLVLCRQRDPKGLYARADRGEIAEFTGVSSPYESPLTPDLVLHTERESVSHCVARIVSLLPVA